MEKPKQEESMNDIPVQTEQSAKTREKIQQTFEEINLKCQRLYNDIREEYGHGEALSIIIKSMNNIKEEVGQEWKREVEAETNKIKPLKEKYYEEAKRILGNKQGINYTYNAELDFADKLRDKFGGDAECRKRLYFHSPSGSTPPYDQLTNKEDFQGEYSVKSFYEKELSKLEETERQKSEKEIGVAVS